MNSYSGSDGERYTQDQIDRNIRKAKEKKLDEFFDDHGYYFCEICGGNHPGERIDCSHVLSVDWCKKNGCVEMAWDIDNIKLAGRTCHQKLDKLNLQS